MPKARSPILLKLFVHKSTTQMAMQEPCSFAGEDFDHPGGWQGGLQKADAGQSGSDHELAVAMRALLPMP
jgi:hypothetical protein